MKKMVCFLLVCLLFTCTLSGLAEEVVDNAVEAETVTAAVPKAVEKAGEVVSVGMLTTLILLLLGSGVICLFIIIWYKAAKNMARIAADKGYTERKWFHYCFWMGLFGFLMVCAMPKKEMQQGQNGYN